MSKAIQVDTKTFIRFWLVILGFALAFLFIYRAWTGLLIVGFAAFFAIAIRPLALKINNWFLRNEKTGKENLSATLAFLIVIFVLVMIVAVIGPVVINETSRFVRQIPEMFEKTIGGWAGVDAFGENFGIQNLSENLSSSLSGVVFGSIDGAVETVMSSVTTVGGVLGAVGLTLILTLLFLLEGPKLYHRFWQMLNGKRKDETIRQSKRVISRMTRVVSTYVSKQVTVALLDGTVTALVVFIISIIFRFSPGLALPMGMITMVFYLISMFGQIIGCVLVSLILLFSNPLAGVIFAVFYIIYAQVENNGIAPKIQGDALRLSPLIILVSITIGMYVAGLIGAIIAIPVAGCVKVLVEEYPRMKELKEKD